MAVELYLRTVVPSFRMTITRGLRKPIRSGAAPQSVRPGSMTRPTNGRPIVEAVRSVAGHTPGRGSCARVWMRPRKPAACSVYISIGENAADLRCRRTRSQHRRRSACRSAANCSTDHAWGHARVCPFSARATQGHPPALDIASMNAPALSVVSGSIHLKIFAALLAAKDISCARIPIDIAAHSRSLDAICRRGRGFLRSIRLRAPLIPIVTNLRAIG